MLSITHATDLHICDKHKEQALKALRFILETSRDREVGAIIFSGDFFDGPVVFGTMMCEVANLLSIAPCPIYIIRGTPSHDQDGAVDLLGKLALHNGQYIYAYTTQPDSFEVVKRGLYDVHPSFDINPPESFPCGHFSFLPAPTKSFLAQDATGSPEEINQILQTKLRTILADFGAKAADSPRPHILVSHITVAGCETSTGQVMLGGDIQVSAADLALANADYVALGHIHKAQKIGSNIYYAGSPFHLSFGELEEKGFNIVTFDDDGNLDHVDFIRTDSRARQVIDAEIVDGKLILSEHPQFGADVRMRIYGDSNQFTKDLEAQAIEQSIGCYSLKIENIPTIENRVRAADLSQAKTLREKLGEYSKVKSIDIPDGAYSKADELESEVGI